MSDDNILIQLQELRKLYADALPDDRRIMEQYAGIICKSINRHAEELGSTMCRRLLADLMSMPLPKPSYIYSSVLWAATKVSAMFPEFHFVPFLNLWNPENLRQEDYAQGKSDDGKVFPSLAERMIKASLVAQLIRFEEQPECHTTDMMGYLPVTQMVVTKVTQAEVKGRKMFFVKLISNGGMEAEAESHLLRVNPLNSSDKKHYVNVGQLYNVLLKRKESGDALRVVDAVLSAEPLTDVFETVTGYVEYIDEQHGHIHVYDSLSRHFVSSGQRFVNPAKDSFVSFVPVIPSGSLFKTAVIVPSRQSQGELMASFPLRDIVITHVNEEKQYASWELKDKDNPITEQLSPLQLSKGETSPSFTSGFVDLQFARSQCADIAVGVTLSAIIYLTRGKDRQKRPRIKKILST